MLILIPFSGFAQIWRETFETLSNGATYDNGSTAWTTTQPSGPSRTFSKQYIAGLGRNIFAINDTGNEGVWRSQAINISSAAEVSIEVEMGCYWTNTTDYIRCYYKIDGGAEVLFGELTGSTDLIITSAASAIVRGNTVEIVIRANENTGGFYGGSLRMMGFDNITVSNIAYLYSRTSGNWNNVNTWSSTGYDGASCNCTPDQNTHVFVGNDTNVNLNANVTSAGVTIENSGRINYTANAQLNIARGGVLEIRSNGILDKNGNNTSTILFSTYTYDVVVDGDLSVGSINISGAGVTFSGSGNINVSGNLAISNVAGKTISNAISGDLSIGGALNFLSTASNVSFINSGQLYVGNRIHFDNDNVAFFNSGSVTTGINGIVINDSNDDGNKFVNSGTLNVGTVNLNGGDFELDNTGLITQTGNFSNISSGSAFRNQNGGIWNFSGGGTNSRLFTSTSANTFNYSGSGDQNIFVPADGAYHHLTLSGGGTKTPAGNLTIEGNLEISGTSSMDVSMSDYELDVAGDFTVSSSNVAPFVSHNGTVRFTGNADQHVSSTSGVSSFYNLDLNKPSGELILSSSPATDIGISGTLILASGGMVINGNTLTIHRSSESAISRTNGYVKSESSGAPYSRLVWAIGASTGTYVFPFGKSDLSDDYIPFTFDVNTAGSGEGRVSLATYGTTPDNQPLPSGVTDLNRNGQDNSSYVADRFWQIDLEDYDINPTADITFTATPDEVGSVGQLRAQRWNSLLWESPIEGQINNSLNSVTVPGVNAFSPWTLSGSSSVLPVELVFFKAVVKGDVVDLEWRTYQEINNDFFTIEKTKDFVTFVEVDVVNGHGTSKTGASYKTTDEEPMEGLSYYRLKQTDFDGSSAYFKPVAVEYNNDGKGLILFPNPSDGAEVFLDLSGFNRDEIVKVEVINAYGKVVHTAFLHPSNENRIKFNGRLLPGIYFIRVGADHSKWVVR